MLQSQKHERRLAKKFGGDTVLASGAFWTRKGDVRTPQLLIEHKWTGKLQFTLRASVLEKIVMEAVLDGRTPVLGVHLNGENYVLLTEDDFLGLLPPDAEDQGATAAPVTDQLEDVRRVSGC